MKKGGGKSKGGAFERTYAKKISLWLTNDERDDCIWRTAGSGSKATVTQSDTMVGDLMSVRPEAVKFFDTFTLELKFYKELNFLGCNTKNFKLFKWWEQVVEDSSRAKNIPLIIFRINNNGDWVVHNDVSLRYINEETKEQILNAEITSASYTVLSVIKKIYGHLYIEPADSFFNRLNRNYFNQIILDK